LKISNNCTCFESNTEVTVRFEMTNIRTALNKNPTKKPKQLQTTVNSAGEYLSHESISFQVSD